MKSELCLLLSASILVLTSCRKATTDSYIKDESAVTTDKKLEQELTQQNSWVYDQMSQQYYWYKDLPDSTGLDFKKPTNSFFNFLRSSQDQFSWIEPNSNFSGSSLYDNYGFEYSKYSTIQGTQVYRIILVLPDSPAQKAGLKRGNWFRITSNQSVLSNNLLELVLGEIWQGDFIPQKAVKLNSISLKSYTTAVSLDTIYRISDKRIGYLVYNQFIDGEELMENPYRAELKKLFLKFKQGNITDFIIDLRHNPGGYLSICQYLCGLILPNEYLGQISGYHEFNDKLAQKQFVNTGSRLEVQKFPDELSVKEYNISRHRIYVIISKGSASASESLINSLEPFIEVVKVGTTTRGKGVGSWTIKDNRYKYQIQPITFRYYNKNQQTVPDSGLVPDFLADDQSSSTIYEIGDIRELLLSTTLSKILGIKTKSMVINKLIIKMIDDLPNENRKIQGLIQTRR